GEVVEEIDGAQAAAAWHVLHDDRRMAGNELAEVARKQPRIDVVAAARPGADNEIDLPSLVEVRNRFRMRGSHRQHRSEHRRRTPAREHFSSAFLTKLTAPTGAFNAWCRIWFPQRARERERREARPLGGPGSIK